MPKLRKDGTPVGWRFKFGQWRYRVPRGQEHAWDGKKEFTLGRTLPEAYKTWGERIGEVDNITRMDQLFERYVRDAALAKEGGDIARVGEGTTKEGKKKEKPEDKEEKGGAGRRRLRRTSEGEE